jgi:hypothetical protein
MVPVRNGRKTHGYREAEQDLAACIKYGEADKARTTSD